jgi:hypothetical protein
MSAYIIHSRQIKWLFEEFGLFTFQGHAPYQGKFIHWALPYFLDLAFPARKVVAGKGEKLRNDDPDRTAPSAGYDSVCSGQRLVTVVVSLTF